MVAQILIQDAASATPTQISFHDQVTSTYGPVAANTIEIGGQVDVQLDLTAVIDTQARMSAKADLGVNRAPAYVVTACIEFATAPTSGDLIEFYWGASSQSTAANGNPGNLTGADNDYTGSPADLAEGVAQLQYLGAMVCTNDGSVTQIQDIGVFSPSQRYGILVVKNECGQTICTDTVETAIVLTPIVPESQ